MKIQSLMIISLSFISSILIFPTLDIKSFASDLPVQTKSHLVEPFKISQLPTQRRPRGQRFLLINLIQKEISHSLKRLNPLLTTYILVAVLVPTTSVFMMLVLFFKLTQESQRFCQNLDSIKEDFKLEFYARVSDAQEMVYEIYDSLQVTEEKIQTIQYQLDSISTQDDDLQDYTVEDEKHRIRNKHIVESGDINSYQSPVTSHQ